MPIESARSPDSSKAIATGDNHSVGTTLSFCTSVKVFKKGFARFTTINYTNDFSEMDNELVHLTNVAILAGDWSGPAPCSLGV